MNRKFEKYRILDGDVTTVSLTKDSKIVSAVMDRNSRTIELIAEVAPGDGGPLLPWNVAAIPVNRDSSFDSDGWTLVATLQTYEYEWGNLHTCVYVMPPEEYVPREHLVP